MSWDNLLLERMSCLKTELSRILWDWLGNQGEGFRFKELIESNGKEGIKWHN